jgi:hypothetical protein
MRNRPIRPNIYLEVVKFGVVVGDWKYILAGTLIGYLGPFFLDLKAGPLPLWFVGAVGSAAALYVFFRFAKVGRKPQWLQHSVKALMDGPVARRTLPGDRAGRQIKPWLLKSR